MGKCTMTNSSNIASVRIRGKKCISYRKQCKNSTRKKDEKYSIHKAFFCSCRVPKRKYRGGEPEPLQLGDPGPYRGVALGPGEHSRLRRGPLQRHPHGPRQGGRLRPLPHDLGSVAARSVFDVFIKIIAF